MPKIRWEDNDTEQDWETVIFTKPSIKDNQKESEPTFGSKIIQARTLNQITKHSFAQTLGVTVQTIEKWENDDLFPSKSQLVRINRILNTSFKPIKNINDM
jgi:DNA-binding transcriptional regulator YiaG